MPRVKKSVKSRKRRKKVLAAVSGFRGARGRLYRIAKMALDRARTFAYRDRKTKKRTFRALWISRLNAAARSHQLTYSQLIGGLAKANIKIDRKILAEMAISEPGHFAKIVEVAKGTSA